MFCENCGSPIPEDSKFCLSCGAKVASVEPEGQAVQETAVVADTVQVDEAPAADTVVQTEQQAAPAEPIQYEPQPKPVAPVAQPKPVAPVAQPKPVQPAPQPEPNRYAPPQPAPQAQAYQQPAAPMSQPAIVKSDKPLPTWKFIGIFLLTGIPIIGFIMILVWSFGHSCNKNTKSYARAALILFIIGVVLSIVGIIINLEAIRTLVDYFNSNFEIGIVG